MKSKVYAVKQGRETGIFYSWDDCEKQVKGFKGAVYKSFKTEGEASSYLNSEGESVVQKENKPKKTDKPKKSVEEELALTKKFSSDPSFLVVYTDGSFTTADNTSRYSYGLVVVENNEITFEDRGVGENEEAAQLWNVAGELSGVMKALLYIKNHNSDRTLVVFHDYEGVSAWVEGTWKAKNPLVRKYVEFVKKFDGIIPIQFVKVTGHKGNPFNERADTLARQALGLKE